MVKRFLFLLVCLYMASASFAADESPNARQARRIFDKAYAQVFGPQGSSFRYEVNIIGIYKTKGSIWMKEKKQRFSDERVDTWNDGVTAYMVYRKKKTIEVHNANSDKKDKYSGKFKFTLDDFSYHIAEDDQDLLITLKQKKGAKGSIKEVRAWIDRRTLAPLRLRIKVAFIWTTVKITDFHAGNVSDQLFAFPKDKYGKDYKVVDRRSKQTSH